jgi:hypothetical protein
LAVAFHIETPGLAVKRFDVQGPTKVNSYTRDWQGGESLYAATWAEALPGSLRVGNADGEKEAF